MDLRTALIAGVLPGLAAGVLFALTWVISPALTARRLRLPVRDVNDPRASGPRWMAPPLFPSGLIAAAFAWHGWPTPLPNWPNPFWPHIATYRFMPIAGLIFLTAAVGLIPAFARRPWALGLLFAPAGAIAAWAFLGVLPHRFPSPAAMWAVIAAIGALCGLQAWAVERAAIAAPRLGAPLAVLILAAAASVSLFGAAHFANGAILLAPVIAVLSAGLFIVPVSALAGFDRGSLAPAVVIITAVLTCGNWHADPFWLPMALLLAAPILLALTPLAARIAARLAPGLGPRAPALACVLIALLLAAAVVVISIGSGETPAADDPFAGYGS